MIPGICGYKIDESRSRKQVKGQIRDAMTSAFEMVDATVERLPETPLSPNTVDLLGQLFARPGNDARTA